MIKLHALSLAMTVCLSANEFPLQPGELENINKGLQQWLELAAEQGDLSKEEYIAKLGLGLRKTSQSMPYRRGDREGVHRVIREKMISVTGRAEYYGDQITQSYDPVKEAFAQLPVEGTVPWYRYLQESREAFATLALLPSPETVRVLGEMLSDDWTWPGMEDTEGVKNPLGVRALGSLAKLPFANAPTGELLFTKDQVEHLEEWKSWYAEVKSGRRTFRFIGDDTEYDLRGPVRRGGFGRIDRSAKPDVADEKDELVEKKLDKSELDLLPYLGVLLFLAVGIWCFLRMRNAK